MANMATAEAFVAFQAQVAEMSSTQQRFLEQNTELQRQVAAHAVADPWAVSREAAAATGQSMPSQFNPTANFGTLVKPPQFNFGKQCCPEPFNGKAKGGFKDYSFKMANFIAMTAVNYGHVMGIFDRAAKTRRSSSRSSTSRRLPEDGLARAPTTKSSARTCGAC